MENVGSDKCESQKMWIAQYDQIVFGQVSRDQIVALLFFWPLSLTVEFYN